MGGFRLGLTFSWNFAQIFVHDSGSHKIKKYSMLSSPFNLLVLLTPMMSKNIYVFLFLRYFWGFLVHFAILSSIIRIIKRPSNILKWIFFYHLSFLENLTLAIAVIIEVENAVMSILFYVYAKMFTFMQIDRSRGPSQHFKKEGGGGGEEGGVCRKFF